MRHAQDTLHCFVSRVHIAASSWLGWHTQSNNYPVEEERPTPLPGYPHKTRLCLGVGSTLQIRVASCPDVSTAKKRIVCPTRSCEGPRHIFAGGPNRGKNKHYRKNSAHTCHVWPGLAPSTEQVVYVRHINNRISACAQHGRMSLLSSPKLDD